jgi:hypothetical protein
MDDESRRTRFKFLRLHRLLLIHHRRGRGWVVDSLSGSHDGRLWPIKLARGTPFSLPKLPILPKQGLWSLVERCTDTDRRWEGLRQRARRKRKGKERAKERC